MAVGHLWREPGSIHVFVLDGKSYRLTWITAEPPLEQIGPSDLSSTTTALAFAL